MLKRKCKHCGCVDQRRLCEAIVLDMECIQINDCRSALDDLRSIQVQLDQVDD